MSNLHNKWIKFNDDLASKGLPSISFEEWIKEYHKKNLASKTIKYLELNKSGPNRGTKNKQELMKSVIKLLSDWKNGANSEWRSKLSIRLGLSPRTVRENYLDPLIDEGVISKVGSKLYFVGPPEDVTEASNSDQ